MFSNPFQVSVPSKCHPSSARRVAFQKQKSDPWGLAENQWQSSTWPINILYLSTMYYREYANYLQEKRLEILKFFIRSPPKRSEFVINLQMISYRCPSLGEIAGISAHNSLYLLILGVDKTSMCWQSTCMSLYSNRCSLD